MMQQPDLPAQYRPWSPEQVTIADSWPTRRDQPVSVVMSPAADRLALSVGQKLTIRPISGCSRGTAAAAPLCADARVNLVTAW